MHESPSFLAEIRFRTNEQNPRYSRHALRIFQGFKHWYRTGLQGGSDRSKVDFGQVYLGDSAAGEALFVNINVKDSTVIVIDSLWISPRGADVEVSGGTIELGTPILPGDSVTIGVKFAPTRVDSLESTFLCAQTSEPCVASLCWLLRGEGLPSGIVLSESSLAFTAPICWDGSAILDTIVLGNDRQTPYTILDVSVPDSADFELVEPLKFPITVSPNDQMVVVVQYRPTTRTTTSELTVQSDIPGSEQFGIPLRGTSRPVDLSVAVDRLDLETHCTSNPVGTLLHFTNPGSITDTITFILASGSSFKVDQGQTLLRAGAVDSVRVTFDPKTAQPAIDTLFLVSEPCSIRDTVLLFGSVNDRPLSVSHETISFDNVPVGTSDTVDVKITNTSQELTLEVTELRLFPSDVGLSIRGVPPSLTLPPSSTFNAQVSWLPTTLEPLPSGSYLEVVIESPCRDTMRIPIRGTGSPGGLLPDRQDIDFGLVLYCEEKVDTLWLRNIDVESVRVTDIDVVPGDVGFAARIIGAPPPPLIPPDSVGIEIRYAPGGGRVEKHQARLLILTDNEVFDTVVVDVQGTRLTQRLSIGDAVFDPIASGTVARKTIRIRNLQSTSLDISGIRVSPPFRLIAVEPGLPTTVRSGYTIDLDVEFAPQTPGIFSTAVVVDAPFTCDTSSLTISGEATGSPSISGRWADVSGDPGTTILIPFELTDDASGGEIRSVRLDARYNPTMLWPLEVVFTDGIAPDWRVDEFERDPGELTIVAAGDIPLQGSGTLLYVRTRVLLGDDTSTVIRSTSNTRFTSGERQLFADSGRFSLTGYCLVDGSRLIRPTNPSVIKSVVTESVAGGTIRIAYELTEMGTARLRIVNHLGQDVTTLAEGAHEIGLHEVEYTGEIASGWYLVILDSPSGQDARVVQIER